MVKAWFRGVRKPHTGSFKHQCKECGSIRQLEGEWALKAYPELINDRPSNSGCMPCYSTGE